MHAGVNEGHQHSAQQPAAKKNKHEGQDRGAFRGCQLLELLARAARRAVVAHVDDAKHFSREVPMTYCPTGWFGRLFLKTPVPHQPYAGFVPDVLLSDSDTLDLDRYGIPGTIGHTSGHTAGSISVQLSSKDAIVGDLIASGILLGGLFRTGHAIRPVFEDDPHTVGLALQRLLDSGMERFYVGHGGPLPADEVRRHARALMKIRALEC